MPYIKQEMRNKMDHVVKAMIDANLLINGDLNYILFTYCKRCIAPSYNNYKNFLGELRQCATEIERKILGPYEDKAIEKNGDIL
jgi:hypothetical protein